MTRRTMMWLLIEVILLVFVAYCVIDYYRLQNKEKYLLPLSQKIEFNKKLEFNYKFVPKWSTIHYFGIRLYEATTNKVLVINERSEINDKLDLNWALVQQKTIVAKGNLKSKIEYWRDNMIVLFEYNVSVGNEYEVVLSVVEENTDITKYNAKLECGVARPSFGVSVKWDQELSIVFAIFAAIAFLVLLVIFIYKKYK